MWNLIWVCVLLYPVLSLSRAGFEPALPKETELKSVALDHSANETFVFFDRQYYYGALTTKLTGNQKAACAGFEPTSPAKNALVFAVNCL